MRTLGAMDPELARGLLVGHAAWVALLSLTTFAVYGIDKRRAKTAGARRISERALHRLSWLGGVAGGWLGRRFFRHKTVKAGFRIRLVLASILHVGIACALAWFVVA